ncbi:MAG: DUF4978 domain-containing protein [Dysgonamonadaceae bacterium]|jgi:hypothetical protein|nr:DUF4978 domain-containing protein [Dysgonamonadaceae bacterium]
MKKIIITLYSLLCVLSISACKDSKNEINSKNEIDTTPKETLRHLMVNGKPFLMLGGQLRTDFFLQLDKKTPDELNIYFDLAAKMNVMAVQIPIGWKDIEPRKDSYTGTLVEKYIELCDRYDLKLELLWFGSYMCGYSVEGYIPDYVVYNSSSYPELKPDAAFQGWLGKHYFLKPNTPALVEREEKAIQYMMNVIYQYDNTHGKKHTVIGIQVENEPDMLATRHNQSHGYTNGQLWPDIVRQLDRLGKVVKNADYKCYTRVNIVLDGDYLQRCENLVATQGIDYAGLDPYQNKITDIDIKLHQLYDINGNYAHIAENGGEYENTDLLTLKAMSLGCGYEVFEVITTPHPYLVDWTLRGVWNPDFTPKAHTQRVVDAFKIFKGAWVDLATADVKDILGFNLKQDDGQTQTTEQQQTSHVTVKWQTTARGVAFAVEYDGHLTVASTQNDEMEFSGVSLSNAEKGHYNMNGDWIAAGSIALTGNKLRMERCTVYRIPVH